MFSIYINHNSKPEVNNIVKFKDLYVKILRIKPSAYKFVDGDLIYECLVKKVEMSEKECA